MKSAAAPPHPGGTWQTSANESLSCGRDHARERGSLDEAARRLTHEEFAVAAQLASEGHDVRSLATRRGQGRMADLLVCGSPVEVKSWDSLEERGGLAPRAVSVVNKLLQAEGQATKVVLNGRESGLSEATARTGMAVYARLARPCQVTEVRVLGEGFDLGWTHRPGTERHPATERQPATERCVRPERERGVSL